MQFIKARILKAKVTDLCVLVAPWEFPILQAIYGEGARAIGTVEVRREPPDPTAEYNRLLAKYKPNENGGAAPVAVVYGGEFVGIKKLGDEIAKASAKPKVDPPPEPKADPPSDTKAAAKKAA